MQRNHSLFGGMWTSIRGRGNNNHSSPNRGARQPTLGNFTPLNGNGQNGTNGRVFEKTDLNFNKDNNINSANSPPIYFKGSSGPVSLNGINKNGQPEYVLDENNIPMRPLILAPGTNGSNRNLQSHGVATRGGGSYLLQPPGKAMFDNTLTIIF